MKATVLSLIALAAVGTRAAPLLSAHDLVNRAEPPCVDDVKLLQFALYFENFQNAFYRQGLANFTAAEFEDAGYSAAFYSNVTDIASHERTHVQSLKTTLESLNASLVDECDYEFNVTSPAQFVTTASLIESVSVSAYLGNVALYTDPNLQTVVSSILAVEARHSSYVRARQGFDPFATPFETPLDRDEAYTLAELFVNSCPSSNPDFGLKVRLRKSPGDHKHDPFRTMSWLTLYNAETRTSFVLVQQSWRRWPRDHASHFWCRHQACGWKRSDLCCLSHAHRPDIRSVCHHSLDYFS